MIKWKKSDLADPEYDLCTKVSGVYADIVQNIGRQWSCLWNSVRVSENHDSREAAIVWFENNIGDLRRGKFHK